MYELAKQVAVESFGVNNRIFPKDPDKPLFFYGLPDNELAYHEIPDQQKLNQLLSDILVEYNKLNIHQQISVTIFDTIIEKTLKINRSMQQ